MQRAAAMVFISLALVLAALVLLMRDYARGSCTDGVISHQSLVEGCSAPTPRLAPTAVPSLPPETDFGPNELLEPSPVLTTPEATLIPLLPSTTLTPPPSSTTCPDPNSIARPLTRTNRLLLPILMYHHLQILPANASALWRGLTVAPEAFADQVAYLASHDYHTIYLSDLIAYWRDGRALPENPIILTFDDAWRDDYTVAFPTLRRYCLTGTFFPPINWIDHSPLTLTWAQIQEMSAAGMEFESHTVNHHLLSQETATEIRQQLLDSKSGLEAHVRNQVVALAYPGGAYSALVIALLSRNGYGAALTTIAGVYQNVNEIYTLRRMGIRYWDTLDSFASKLH